MSCQITDIIGYRNNLGVLVGTANLNVIAVPDTSRSTYDYAGDWHPNVMFNPLIVGNPSLAHGQIATTDVNGEWTHVLPNASAETHPVSPEQKWSLLFPDGSVLTGEVPAVAGPLTVDDLVQTYGWVWASSLYVAPVTEGSVARGTATFSGAGSTVSVVFATPFAAATYQLTWGSSVDANTLEAMPVSYTNKTTSGFDLVAKDAAYVGTVDWEAKL